MLRALPPALQRRACCPAAVALTALFALAGCSRQAQPPAAPPTSSAMAAAPGPAAKVPREKWSLALLPDTQHYSDQYPQLFDAQCSWLAKQAKAINLKYVVGLGDITDKNTKREWDNAKHAIGLLDGVAPVALVTGNHDTELVYSGGQAAKENGLDAAFPAERLVQSATFGGLFQPSCLANSYHLFSANQRDWMILCLEAGPRDPVVAWANSVLDKYPERAVIIATHIYLDKDGQRIDSRDPADAGESPRKYAFSKAPGGTNDGEELWHKLIRKHANVVLVVCGHVHGVSHLTSTNDIGGEVHQILVDYQDDPEGGGGFLRLLTFSEDGRSIEANSYSPAHGLAKTDAGNAFTLSLTKTFAEPK